MLLLLVTVTVLTFFAMLFYPHWREYETRRIHSQSQYEDSPRPDGGFISANILALVLLLPVVLGVVWRTADVPLLMFALTGLLAAVLVYQAVMLHACYATHYRIYEQELELGSGLLARRIVPLKDMLSVSHIDRVERVLGWGPRKAKRGFGNRTKNGVLLVTNSEQYFLTPSNTELFMDKVTQAIQNAKEPPLSC